MSPAETDIASVLAADENLRPTTSLLVRDVSGGCGSMYAIEIASPRFRGKGLLAQQRLVTRALGDRVKEWHGVQIRTTVPPEEEGADPAAKS
jgi:stress-induced morphogen